MKESINRMPNAVDLLSAEETKLIETSMKDNMTIYVNGKHNNGEQSK